VNEAEIERACSIDIAQPLDHASAADHDRARPPDGSEKYRPIEQGSGEFGPVSPSKKASAEANHKRRTGPRYGPGSLRPAALRLAA
jgi:hypothetical protein